MTVDVVALQNRILDLEKAGKRAGAITAIVALLGTVVGAIIAAFGLYVQFNDELRNWETIKQVHAREVSGRELFDHGALSSDELSLLKAELDLPDFSDFVTKSNLSQEVSALDLGKPDDLPNFEAFALKEEIPSIDGLVTRNELPDFNKFARLTSLSSLAKRSEIPSLTDYAKSEDIPVMPNLSGYVKFGDSILISYGQANIFPNDGYVLYDNRRVAWKIQRP